MSFTAFGTFLNGDLDTFKKSLLIFDKNSKERNERKDFEKFEKFRKNSEII